MYLLLIELLLIETPFFPFFLFSVEFAGEGKATNKYKSFCFSPAGRGIFQQGVWVREKCEREEKKVLLTFISALYEHARYSQCFHGNPDSDSDKQNAWHYDSGLWTSFHLGQRNKV